MKSAPRQPDHAKQCGSEAPAGKLLFFVPRRFWSSIMLVSSTSSCFSHGQHSSNAASMTRQDEGKDLKNSSPDPAKATPLSFYPFCGKPLPPSLVSATQPSSLPWLSKAKSYQAIRRLVDDPTSRGELVSELKGLRSLVEEQRSFLSSNRKALDDWVARNPGAMLPSARPPADAGAAASERQKALAATTGRSSPSSVVAASPPPPPPGPAFRVGTVKLKSKRIALLMQPQGDTAARAECGSGVEGSQNRTSEAVNMKEKGI